MNSRFDNNKYYYGTKKSEPKSIAEMLGLKDEELASIISHGGCENSKFRVIVTQAHAVFTSHDNPFI